MHGDVTDLRRSPPRSRRTASRTSSTSPGLQVPTCRADPMLGAKVNVLGTLAVFEAVKAAGDAGAAAGLRQLRRRVRRAGQVSRRPAAATTLPLVPSTHYGVFKCCNEGNARIYFQDHGISSIGLRPWTVYGVGRDFGMTSEPTKAIKALLLGRPYHITFGGWQDFQYVDDVAKTFVRCLDAAVHRGEELQPPRRRRRRWPTFHPALCAVAAGRGEADHARRRRRSPSPTTSTTPASNATWGRCRRRRSKTASARRWRSSGSSRRKAGSIRPISMPPSPPRSRLPMSRSFSCSPASRSLHPTTAFATFPG